MQRARSMRFEKQKNGTNRVRNLLGHGTPWKKTYDKTSMPVRVKMKCAACDRSSMKADEEMALDAVLFVFEK